MSTDTSPLGRNLERLYVMRNIAIAGQILVIAMAHFGLDMTLPLFPLGLTVFLLALLNIATKFRLGLPSFVTDIEFFVQLLLDVAALTSLLYFSGGSTNPFVSLYLLPLVIAATALPWRYTWLMAAITVTCYTALLFYFVELPHHHGESDFNLHVFAMWLTFVLSTALIAWFVVRMGNSLKERDKLLAKAREDALRNEQIVALGTLAAGAAHELGTPLSTIAVIAGELKAEHGKDPQLNSDLSLLSAQVDSCKKILTGILEKAGHTRAEGGNILPVDRFMSQILEQWQLMRPSVVYSYQEKGEFPSPAIVSEQTLSQAILNLLNNAADASNENIDIVFSWSDNKIWLEIRDHGPGLTPEAAAKAKDAFFTTKEGGLGIGLFLANASIERFGGKVSICNQESGGACTEVFLPLASLHPEGNQK